MDSVTHRKLQRSAVLLLEVRRELAIAKKFEHKRSKVYRALTLIFDDAESSLLRIGGIDQEAIPEDMREELLNI